MAGGSGGWGRGTRWLRGSGHPPGFTPPPSCPPLVPGSFELNFIVSSLALDKIKCFDFNMDYTLASKHGAKVGTAIGYPAALWDYAYDPWFPTR